MSQPKRRRIIINDDDEENAEVADDLNESSSVGSNPDEQLQQENDSEEEEGEDLNENWIDDYAPAPELDQYDPTVLAADDDEDALESYEKIMRDRRSAEEMMDIRDAKRKDFDRKKEYELERLNVSEMRELEEEDYEDDDLMDGDDKALNLEAFECPLREWLAEERTRREIQRRFRKFLVSYYVGIDAVTRWIRRHEHITPLPSLPAHLKVLPSVYPPKIRAMCAANSASLEVSYAHLAEVQSQLVLWLTEAPRDMLQIFDEVLQSVVLTEFPHYARIVHEVHVRLTNLPLSDNLRDLRQIDLNFLVHVTGVVTRRTAVFPMMRATAYDCSSCGYTMGPFRATGSINLYPEQCVNCQGKGQFKVNPHKTEYGNFQKLTLQETPGSVPPGRVPRYKEVVLVGDLIDNAKPGEEIEITGIYSHSQHQFSKDKNGFPVYHTNIEANCIQKRNGTAKSVLSDEDKRQIRELSHDPQIGERIIRSMAPSIYGHRHVKTALALSLFGGCQKDSGSSGGMHRVRGDINILLLGDPGTAKSQILKYAEKIAPRSVYTTGKGASAVGLTAGVHRDPQTREWTLEGGALVLADQGVCLIDEFDKMNEQDRTSIHEAMEQQTISVSKAGIVTSLQARCAVIAAANPIGGRYDPTYNLAENVELTDPILQRFDVLCVLQDLVDPIIDEKLAAFVVSSHMKSHPEADDTMMEEDDGDENANDNVEDEKVLMFKSDGFFDKEVNYKRDHRKPASMNQSYDDNGPKPLDQQILKKYITYARAYVKPVLHDVDSEKIASLYADLRAQSALSGGVPIAVRHIESVMRMAEASAKMHLREHVREDDIDMAIKVMLESFLQAQKVSVRKMLHRNFKKYTNYGEESNQLLMHQLQGLILDAEKYKLITQNKTKNITEVFTYDLENRAKELNIYDLRSFYKSAIFRNHLLELDEERGVIIKHYL